ncbi:hypothetical protein ACF0H5_015862 [Mactra antiquata]
MSLRTRINGFTAWVNLRLTPYNQLLSNVLMDLLTGTHMKYLLESFTGSHLKGLENMDGLTDQQKQTRIDWVVAELKKKNVIADDVFVDTRLFAMRSADHVFNLLWRLISHDIWFVWERAEYLQVDDLDVLTQVPFKWTPEPPPKKKKHKNKSKKSLLSGFGPPVSEGAEDKSEKSEEALSIMSCQWSTSISLDMTICDDAYDDDNDHIAADDDEAVLEIPTSSFASNNDEIDIIIISDDDDDGNDGNTIDNDEDFSEYSYEGHIISLEDTSDGTESMNLPETPDVSISIYVTDSENDYNDLSELTTDNECDKDTGKLCDVLNSSKQWKLENISEISFVTSDNESTIPYNDVDLPIDNDNQANGEHDDKYDVVDDDAEYEKELVSIYIVPLNDTDENSDARQTISRASPWPEEEFDSAPDEFATVLNSSSRIDDNVTMSNGDTIGLGDVNDDEDFLDTQRIESSAIDESKFFYDIDAVAYANRSFYMINDSNLEDEQSKLIFDKKFETMPYKDLDRKTPTFNIETRLKKTSGKEHKAIKRSSISSKGSASNSSRNMSEEVDHKFRTNSSKSRYSCKSRTGNSSKGGNSTPKYTKGSNSHNMKYKKKDGKVMSGSTKETPCEKHSKGDNLTKFMSKGSNSPSTRLLTPFISNKRMGQYGAYYESNVLKYIDVQPQHNNDNDEKWIMFPNAEYMKGFKKKTRNYEDYPTPDECVLEMVNYQLKKHFASTRHPSSVNWYTGFD